MTKINQLESLRVLKAVVESGSFTAAAHRLKISAARVSKSIEHLEGELESVLFNRSTRYMKVTEAGERCYRKSLVLIEQWQELKEELVETKENPKGKLRISAPMTWGLNQLVPVLDVFMSEFPDIELDIQLNDQRVNVLEEQYDLVLRLAEDLADSSLICRKITEYHFIACAAPAYLAERGEPQQPHDLKAHDCLMYLRPGASRHWQFLEKNKKINIFLEANLTSNNSLLLHSAALAGKGIGLFPDFVVAEDLKNKRLIPLLQNFQTAPLNLYSLRPGNRMQSYRLQVLHDYLVSCFYISQNRDI
ncbi:MAG: LysR family transcriptional regulator [Sneathiella sp.]